METVFALIRNINAFEMILFDFFRGILHCNFIISKHVNNLVE